MLAGHASGCWLSALGAGVPYNRQKKTHFRHYFPANSDSSLTEVPSLQTTGFPQGTGFPSTYGQHSCTFEVFKLIFFCSGTFLTLIPRQAAIVSSLKKTGSTQGTGFPSISGQNSGTFGLSLRGAFRGMGNFFET